MANSGGDFLSLYRVRQILDKALVCSICSKRIGQGGTQNYYHVICGKCSKSAPGASSGETTENCWRCDLQKLAMFSAAVAGASINPEDNGALVDQLANLRDQLNKMSLATVAGTCTVCGQLADISNIWNCQICSINAVCTKCIVGRCEHKSDTIALRMKIEKAKSQCDNWRMASFDNKWDELSLGVQKLAGKIQAASDRLNSMADIPAHIRTWCSAAMEFFKVEQETLFADVNAIRNDLSKLNELLMNYKRLAPRLASIGGLMDELDRRAVEIDGRIKSTDANLSTWLQQCVDWGHVRLQETDERRDDAAAGDPSGQ